MDGGELYGGGGGELYHEEQAPGDEKRNASGDMYNTKHATDDNPSVADDDTVQ
jgi:hypothetical protein